MEGLGVLVKFFAKESTTVGLWHFEETSGATQSDGSGNGYNLTDNANAPTRITTTDFGGGLSFDGNNDYTERNGGGANLEAARITVEILFYKPSPHSGDFDMAFAYNPRGAAFDGRGWQAHLQADGKMRWRLGTGSGYTNIIDPVVCPLDRWLYFAMTYDGTNGKLYRCGTLVAGPTASAAISYAASPNAGATTFKTFTLGAEQQNDAVYRNFGRLYLADLRVSNIAKSDSDIFNEQLTQQYCETEPTAAAIPPPMGGGMQLPFAPYQRYKSIRAAVAQYNNLVLGP